MADPHLVGQAVLGAPACGPVFPLSRKHAVHLAAHDFQHDFAGAGLPPERWKVFRGFSRFPASQAVTGIQPLPSCRLPYQNRVAFLRKTYTLSSKRTENTVVWPLRIALEHVNAPPTHAHTNGRESALVICEQDNWGSKAP